MRKLLIFLAFLMPLCCKAQEPRWAVVDVSSCFLRQKPDYESANESQCLMGTVVEVTGADRYWRKVNVPDYKDVWTNELCLAFMTESQKDAYIAAPKWMCAATYSTIYSAPDHAAEPVCDFIKGDLVRKDGAVKGDWAPVLTASGRKGWVPARDLVDYETWASSVKAWASSVIATALSLRGVPYMWGGNTVKHFDCSGFTKFVYMMNGIVLPRNASQQIKTGETIPYDLSKMRAGDLVFFGNAARGSVTHVALYMGDGKIIHSSMLVRVNSLVKGEEDYYEKEVVGVRRILGHADDGSGISSVKAGPWYFKK